MASSGSTKVNFTKYDDLVFSWWINSQSIENNTTTIGWKMEIVAGSYGQIIASAQSAWTITVNGTTYTGKANLGVENNSTKTLATGTTTIAHNADGSKTFSYSFSQDMYIKFSGVSIHVVSGSGSGTIDTIPRKSSLTASNGTLGTAQTLTVTKQASGFTHTITYACGSASGMICTKSSSTSISWTPPNELANQAPNGSSVAVTLTITTYNGSASVGSSSVSITCSIPDNATFVPVLLPTISDASGNYAKYGFWVQGQSKVKVDITAYGAYGATISSVRVLFEGAVYTGTSVTTNAIVQSGHLPITITVIDSRGRSSEVKPEIDVRPYSFPKISSLTAERNKEDETELNLHFTVNISLDGSNTSKYYVGYKKSFETAYTETELTYFANKNYVSSVYTISGTDPTSSYTIRLRVVDAFKETTAVIDVATAKKVWSLMKKDNEIVGMAFGKVAEHNGVFDIGFKAKFSGGFSDIADFVVERGEKDGWTYRKWNSGVAECWKILEFSTTINTAFGSLYCGNATQRQTYPFAFASKPVETVTLQSGSTQAFLYVEASGYGVNGTNASARYNVFRPGAITTNETFYLSFFVIGKWK